MNIFKVIGRAFVAVGKGLLGALRFAESRGLTDDLFDLALSLVARAAIKFPDNEARREWSVAELTKRHIPESIARLAVEAAVQAYKEKVLHVA